MSATFNTMLPPSNVLNLQCCGQCEQVNYPPRELCGNCLADDLQWREVDDRGVLQARAELHYSLETQYERNLPWPVGSVKLDCGPVALTHVQPDIENGGTVRVRILRDAGDNRMLVAVSADQDSGEAVASWLAQINFQECSI